MRLYCVTWECDHFVEADARNKTWFSSLQKAKAFCAGLKRQENRYGTAYIQRVEIPARKTEFIKLLNDLNNTLTYLTRSGVVMIDQVDMPL